MQYTAVYVGGKNIHDIKHGQFQLFSIPFPAVLIPEFLVVPAVPAVPAVPIPAALAIPAVPAVLIKHF